MHGGDDDQGEEHEQPPEEAAPAPAQPSPTIDYDELERLGKLHADGTLTDEEFAEAKAKILGTWETPANVRKPVAAAAT